MSRKAVSAGKFYPADKEQCLSDLRICLEKEKNSKGYTFQGF